MAFYSNSSRAILAHLVASNQLQICITSVKSWWRHLNLAKIAFLVIICLTLPTRFEPILNIADDKRNRRIMIQCRLEIPTNINTYRVQNCEELF